MVISWGLICQWVDDIWGGVLCDGIGLGLQWVLVCFSGVISGGRFGIVVSDVRLRLCNGVCGLCGGVGCGRDFVTRHLVGSGREFDLGWCHGVDLSGWKLLGIGRGTLRDGVNEGNVWVSSRTCERARQIVLIRIDGWWGGCETCVEVASGVSGGVLYFGGGSKVGRGNWVGCGYLRGLLFVEVGERRGVGKGYHRMKVEGDTGRYIYEDEVVVWGGHVGYDGIVLGVRGLLALLVLLLESDQGDMEGCGGMGFGGMIFDVSLVYWAGDVICDGMGIHTMCIGWGGGGALGFLSFGFGDSVLSSWVGCGGGDVLGCIHRVWPGGMWCVVGRAIRGDVVLWIGRVRICSRGDSSEIHEGIWVEYGVSMDIVMCQLSYGCREFGFCSGVVGYVVAVGVLCGRGFISGGLVVLVVGGVLVVADCGYWVVFGDGLLYSPELVDAWLFPLGFSPLDLLLSASDVSEDFVGCLKFGFHCLDSHCSGTFGQIEGGGACVSVVSSTLSAVSFLKSSCLKPTAPSYHGVFMQDFARNSCKLHALISEEGVWIPRLGLVLSGLQARVTKKRQLASSFSYSCGNELVEHLSIPLEITSLDAAPSSSVVASLLSITSTILRILLTHLDMSNSDELRHTDNTTLVPPRLPDTLPQVYHRRRPTLGLLILPPVSPFPPTIRRTARISVLPIKPNLAEHARISAINLDDYQLDHREEALTTYGTKTGQSSVPVPETALTVCTTRLRGQLHTILEDMDRYPNACLEELEAFLTLWDVKPQVEESSLETLSVNELITQLRKVCEDAEDRTSNAQEEARKNRNEALKEVVQQIYRSNN
ncbi:hypothetical protein Tco_1448066 [Tanacetum coccineum]